MCLRWVSVIQQIYYNEIAYNFLAIHLFILLIVYILYELFLYYFIVVLLKDAS